MYKFITLSLRVDTEKLEKTTWLIKTRKQEENA